MTRRGVSNELRGISVRAMSPIAAERCLATRDLSEPRLVLDGSAVVYGVAEAGASWLQVHPLDGGAPVRLGESTGVRTARGMGGGAWVCMPDGVHLTYVGGDGNLWLQSLRGGAPHQLTDHGPDQVAAAPAVSVDGRRIAYVIDLAEVHVVDVVARTSSRVDEGGNDFVIDPAWSPQSDLEWVAWDVPDMPWDGSHIERLRSDGVRERLPVPHTVQQVRFTADGQRMSVRDDQRWLNVMLGDRPVVDEWFEHAGPTWGPGQRSYALSPDGTEMAFTRNERGFGRLCVASLATGRVVEVARGVHGQLSWRNGRLAALRTGARTPTQVVVYDAETWERTVVAVGPEGDWSSDELVEPELFRIPASLAGGDEVVHARLYRADAPRGLIVWLHGGPTDQWQVTWMPRIAFWRSRGWNVLVPDHRGSTGHGRLYQQALRGRWGDLDVADTVAVLRWAHAKGLGTPERTVLFGGSAGGYTALGAVAAAPDAVAAAAVLYPVTDLLELAERSHRFERHYTDTLVGPLPAATATARDRSPAFHGMRFTRTPLLLLHGDADPVVPVEQSRLFVDAVRAAGGNATLHVYEGEGHGFRQRDNQLDEYRRVEEFLSSICD